MMTIPLFQSLVHLLHEKTQYGMIRIHWSTPLFIERVLLLLSLCRRKGHYASDSVRSMSRAGQGKGTSNSG